LHIGRVLRKTRYNVGIEVTSPRHGSQQRPIGDQKVAWVTRLEAGCGFRTPNKGRYKKEKKKRETG